jgi:hypothetical protein
MLIGLLLLSGFVVIYTTLFVATGDVAKPGAALNQSPAAVPTAAPRKTAVLGVTDGSDESTVLPSPNSADRQQSPVAATGDAQVTTTATATKPLFADSFTDLQSGWPEHSSTTSQAVYEGGQYKLIARGESSVGISLALPDIEYYRFSADVAVDQGEAGLVFLAEAPATFYRFVITTDGRFAVYVVGQAADDLTVLVEPTGSAALHQGASAINRLQVERKGANVRLYANDQPLIDLEVPTEAFVGQYGFALMPEDGHGQAVFDNLVGEQLSE